MINQCLALSTLVLPMSFFRYIGRPEQGVWRHHYQTSCGRRPKNVVFEWRIRSFCGTAHGDFRSSLQEILAPIDKYDIILGKPWLCSVNPRIDFRTNQVELIPRTSKLHTGASGLPWSAPSTVNAKRTTALNHDVDDNFIRDDAPEELFFMNVKSARKATKKGASWYMIRIHERGAAAELNLLDLAIWVSGPPREELMKLLKRHRDILTKELPCRLPPLRRVNHEIEVEPGSTPRQGHRFGFRNRN